MTRQPWPPQDAEPVRADPGPLTECHDEICITCSDVAVPVRVCELLPDGFAVVDGGAGREIVSVALVEAKPGDVILVHAKEAIAVQEEQR